MVIVQLTNGFGNNMFQYVAARQIAEFFGKDLKAIAPSLNYYAIEDLEGLGFEFIQSIPDGVDFIEVNDSNYKLIFKEENNNYNFIVRGYFEDYTHYVDNIKNIKSWFPEPETRPSNDLVLHFRAGDRLFYKNEFQYKPTAESYVSAIEKFDFDGFHISTDMPEWKIITAEELQSYNFHVNVPEGDKVPVQDSVNYFNSIVSALKKFNPIVIKKSVGQDFSYIRGFDSILFEHGTMSWWASVLSEARKVGVYGPWRPWKKTSNKNLSKIPLEGWFQWE